MPTLGDVTDLLDEWFPPAHADSWDAVGLVCGDPAADVRRILLAVDPVTAVADEAVADGAQLLVCHHPLFLKGVHGVAATDPKGRIVHRLLSAGCGLFTAHTNADSPAGGVSESLALALGLEHVRPLEADPGPAYDKLVVFAPTDSAERIRSALAEVGAGAIGDYDSCTFTAPGRGSLPAARGCPPDHRRGRPGRGGRGGADRDGLPTTPARRCRRRDGGRPPLRGGGVRRGAAGPARRAGSGLGTDRPARVTDDAGGLRGPGLGRAQRDGPRGAGRRRPRPAGRDRRAVRRRRGLPARPGAGRPGSTST